MRIFHILLSHAIEMRKEILLTTSVEHKLENFDILASTLLILLKSLIWNTLT